MKNKLTVNEAINLVKEYYNFQKSQHVIQKELAKVYKGIFDAAKIGQHEQSFYINSRSSKIIAKELRSDGYEVTTYPSDPNYITVMWRSNE